MKFLSPSLTLLGLASSAFAFPAPNLQKRVDDLVWMGNSSLPKVLFLYTGGTIAGGSDLGRLDTTQYGQLSRTGEEILAQVPEIMNITQVAIKNFTSPEGSTGTYDPLVLSMAKYANYALCSSDSDIDGIVFTHGTNSLQETLFLLDLTVNCGKPVVGIGSMRPWSALSFDGNANLYAGFALARHPDSKDRGAMIAFGDRIIPGYWGDKTNANTPDTFKALDQGYLGQFLNNEPFFYNSPSQPRQKISFDVEAIEELPKVDILYAAREFDGQLILDAQKNGAKGVVVAGTGSGSLITGAAAAREAVADGLFVVASTRSVTGASTPARVPQYVQSGFMQPIAARIQLQLCIASGYSYNETFLAFEGPIRSIIGQELAGIAPASA